MMGTRESMRGGDEYDCFSRRYRRLIGKKAGKFTATKAAFWQRIRKAQRLRTEAEAQTNASLG